MSRPPNSRSSSNEAGGSVDPILRLLLVLLVVLPALAVLRWRDGGAVAAVLYRQPKEAAIAILCWLFLAVFCWRSRGGLRGGDSLFGALVDSLRRPEIALLGSLLGWLALTLAWTKVPANGLVELRQYLPLFFLLLVLVAWQRSDSRVALWLRMAWVSSLGLVSLVGLLQLWVELLWLSPINPVIGAPNPSFMGYKNPMALALLGQLFLLAEMAFPGLRRAEEGVGGWPGGPWPWRLLLVAELIHLATLGSRTSLFALAVAAVYLGLLLGLVAWRKGEVDLRWQAWVGALVVVAVFVGALVVHPVGRAKAGSVLDYVAEPARYLESDRGIYLRNTLGMVGRHPLGVGLGDWQTHYPVFRAQGRDVAFTGDHQVRRAHSDPVQFLGEGGWPALVLFLVLLATLVVGTARRALRGERRALFLSAQVLAVAVALSTDYLLDLPYGKLQFFLLLALVLGRSGEESGKSKTEEVGAQSSEEDRRLAALLALVLALTLGVTALYHVQLLRRTVAGAAIQQGYQHWAARGVEGLPALAERVEAHGPTFLASGGHTKTTHRDFLVLAHAAELLGHRAEALAWTRRTLELHPYYPPAYELMATLVDDPAVAEVWRSAHRHILDEASHGFEHPMPPLEGGPLADRSSAVE